MDSEDQKGVIDTLQDKMGTLLISDQDFTRLVRFVQRNYGIDLHQKRQLIQSRLTATIKNRGFDDFKSYVDYLLLHGNGDDINELLVKLTTNYT